MKELFSKKNRSRLISFALVIIIYIVCEVLLKTGNMKSLLKNLLVPVTCYVVATIALNLVVGFSGELSLGHAGFMSIGAFTSICISGLLASSIPNTIIRLVICIICGGIVSAIFGFIIGIPVLKLKGDYLAIVTLAFCQIIKSIINNIYFGFDNNGLQFSFVENKLELGEGAYALISGPMGATGTERIATFTAGIILILITLVIVYNIIDSKNGRAIMACRDNQIAASSIGINTTNVKMLAFVLSAFLAGTAGALYGLNYATLVPAKFDYNQSIMILVYVVFGGLGNITGSIVSTIVLILLPELLRSLQDYRMIIYAVSLIVIMLITNNKKLKTGFERLTNKLKKGNQNNG